MNKKFLVYVHINKVNGKRYYGITSQKPKRRWSNGKGYLNNDHFTNSINKYGWNSFEHIIVARGLTEDEAKWLEVEMIAAHNTNNPEFGYNETKGGDGCSRPCSEETKQKISEANKGKQAGENHPMYGKRGELSPLYGKPRSEETKQKLREFNIGKHCGDKNHMYGKKHTPETIQKMKENQPDIHGKNNPNAKSVICITTKKIFFTAKEGACFYNLKGSADISRNCKGTRKSCGKLSDGTKLVWRYLNYKHNKTYRIA